VKTSQAGVNLIKSFESLSFTPYVDAVGVLTIGYGHTGPDVKPGGRVNQQQAEIILRKDLCRFEEAIHKLVNVELNQNQFDALVSFTFNTGENAFADSTLRKRLNSGEDPCSAAREELPRWNKGNGKVLEGLTRRRMQEVELFCSPAPKLKTGPISITSLQVTWFKKEPVPSAELSNDKKAKIYQGRTIPNCIILDQKDKHTLLELGGGLGKWWIYDAHWDGLKTKTEIKPYAVSGDLRYLRNFPYFYQQDNGPQGWRQCQTSSIAMCLKYFDVPGINDDKDYFKYVDKYGDTTARDSHYKALADLRMSAKFTISADVDDVKKEIDQGRPVVAGILHHGTVDQPTGGGHFVVIFGYGKDYWLVHDPYGRLDLVAGTWVDTSPAAGKNVHYSFKDFNPRLFVSGGANGWCWLNFKRS
jgi:GH24 family phage-related lysozyme (muramidase)